MKSLVFLLLFICLSASDMVAQTAYEIWFTAGSVKHHGLIRTGAGSNAWQMRVKYYDAGCGCERLIEQQMQVEETNLGTRLSGYAVRDVHAKRLTRDYAADRFYLYHDGQGNTWAGNTDEQGISGNMTFRPLTTSGMSEKMREFGW